MKINRSEVAAMASIGAEQGVLEESENKIITNLLRLKKTMVKSIMTPRTVLVAAQQELKVKEFAANPANMNFSRIPIYKDTIDSITGYVLKFDILKKLGADQFNKTLEKLKRPILVSYEKEPVPQLFNKLLKEKEHISVIVNEFGAVEGIVTMEDIIETLLGLEIMDETDSEIDMQKLAREKWKVRSKKLKFK
jgi:CBS domain containing-hemolysin-like protein